jgi:epoxide hydrolase-like predicted phosphatase
MIDFSLLTLVPSTADHKEFCYQVKKATMGGYIEQIWGWDETFQQEMHNQDWQKKQPQIILYNSKPIGTIFISQDENHLEIGRFYILPEYQNQGVGSYFLKQVLGKADKAGIPAQLYVMKRNPAKMLYERYGFVTIKEDELMLFMEHKPERRYKAVIFDLGGTLSRSAPWSVYNEMAFRMAEICSAPTDKFVEMWFSESSGLGTGVFSSYSDYIKHVCSKLKLKVPANLIAHAAEIPVAIDRQYVIKPREDAMKVLAYIKSNGYKIGLISDCAPSLPEIWPETPFASYFDATVFSCLVGMNKADPRIFQIALEKLAVEPESCLYIADGMRNELVNAEKLGMHSVQILVTGEINNSPIREDWHGPVISSLKEILTLV